jgi:hypothetical protein
VFGFVAAGEVVRVLTEAGSATTKRADSNLA